MMSKHTVSIYDMCWSGQDYGLKLWQEKITDAINYLLLLSKQSSRKSHHKTS